MVGLLVSLFNVQLGNWLSKLQGQTTRWDSNHSTTDTEEMAARREVRYAFDEIYNWQPGVMTAIITAFAGGVVYFFNDFRISAGVIFPSIFIFLYNGFFGIMIGLELFLVISGYVVGSRLKAKIKSTFVKAKTESTFG